MSLGGGESLVEGVLVGEGARVSSSLVAGPLPDGRGSGVGGKQIVRTAELAAILGVTSQTVLNYKDRGMPGRLDPDGPAGKRAFLFDVEKCRRWVLNNRPRNGVGGRRPGAGAKPGWKTARGNGKLPPGVLPGGDSAASPLALAAAAVAEEPANPEMDAALGRLMEGAASGADMRLLSGLAGNRPLSRADTEHIEQLSTTNERNRKAAEARGSLVPAADVALEWGETLKRVRSRLETLASRVTEKVMAAGMIAGDREPFVRAAIGLEAGALISELGVG